MKAIIVAYILISLVGIGLYFTLQPPFADERCNWCSGTGLGADCPRHDRKARKACIESYHYCGGQDKDCG